LGLGDFGDRIVDVARRAGVGGSPADRHVGAWDAEAVVAAEVDVHVSAAGHVAIHALGPFGSDGVTVVGGDVVFACGVLVARRAGFVAGVLEFQRVGVMAIGAADPLVVHLALHERAIDIDLVLDLAVGVIGIGLKEFEVEEVVIVLVGGEADIEQAAAAVALGAGLQLPLGAFALQLG